MRQDRPAKMGTKIAKALNPIHKNRRARRRQENQAVAYAQFLNFLMHTLYTMKKTHISETTKSLLRENNDIRRKLGIYMVAEDCVCCCLSATYNIWGTRLRRRVQNTGLDLEQIMSTTTLTVLVTRRNCSQ